VAVLRLTQTIERPVQDVFRTLSAAGDFASWNPTIKTSRQLTPGDVGDGSQFEWTLRGFGKVRQELREFDRDHRLRLVPQTKFLSGGHRFILTDLDRGSRVDHELEMTPQGPFRLFSPIIGVIGRKNLRDTANALKAFLEAQDSPPAIAGEVEP
jgi:uncharacterized protein YndB with AHSA1/START domain